MGADKKQIMKTKIKWRLANRPTPNELTDLVTSGILTKDEAREILISHETDEDRDKASLQDEIKFLRQLVQRLSEGKSQIVETIRYIEKPYYTKPWYQPYVYYCSSGSTGTTATAGYLDTSVITTANSVLDGSSTLTLSVDNNDFTDVKTF